MGTSKGIYKSLDAGESWETMNQGLENLNVRVLRMDPKNFQTLYAGTNGGGLYRSTDEGKSWISLPLVRES